MKKIYLYILTFCSFGIVQAQTTEEILAKYEEAAGGREKLQSVKQLEVLSNLKMGVMGQSIELPMTLIREKGKLFRRQIGGIMGMGDSFTMVTDTSGCIYIGANRFRGGGFGGGGFGGPPPPPGAGGDGPTIIPMKQEEIAGNQYELDPEGAFPELVNTAAKGHSAQLVGTEKVSKTPCYKVKLTLKTGQVVTYYIDQQTGLVKQVESIGDMAMQLTGFGPMLKSFGSNIKKDTKATILVKEWGDFKGIKFPTKYILSFGPIESEVESGSVQINEGLEEKWYHVK
jgi:hypothetical protein